MSVSTPQNIYFQFLITAIFLFAINGVNAQHQKGPIAVVPMKNDHLKIFDYASFHNLTFEIPGKNFSLINQSGISVENKYFIEINYKYNERYGKKKKKVLNSLKKEALISVGKDETKLVLAEDIHKEGLILAYRVEITHEQLGDVTQYTMAYVIWNDIAMVNIISKEPFSEGWDHPILSTCINTLQIHKIPSEPAAFVYGQKMHEGSVTPSDPYSSSTEDFQLLRMDTFGYMWHFDKTRTIPQCYIHEYTSSSELTKENLIEQISNWQKEVFKNEELKVDTTTSKIMAIKSIYPGLERKLRGTNYYYLSKCGDRIVGLYLKCGPCPCDDALVFFREFTESYVCPETEMVLK